MRPVIVDASVAVKLFLPVPGYEKAIAAAKMFELHAPRLIFAETGNALWQYVRHNQTTVADASTALVKLAGLVAQPEEAGLAASALEMACELGHPVYDCTYLALADRDHRPILSADRRMLTLARDRLGLEIIPLDSITPQPAP
ncbi:type II toxin-antitoxin system VapC family toxin [Maricaulis maris]|uniref:type II toxin-antitoxin system VapC family toxin n=1 Tax=Maricaulis maris TaxID=74318 RepID=UPI003B8CE03E